MSERILIVEDDDLVRANFQHLLGSHGYAVDVASSGAEALERLEQDDYGLVVSDIRMPGMDGIELLKRVAAERPETFVMMITGHASVRTAVEALRLGAYDYILKPVSLEDLLRRIRNLFVYRDLKEEVLRLRRDVSERLGFEGLVGESPQMRTVFELIDKLAPTNAAVLITGESGTGKEVIARAIHARSEASEREFLCVNMAAIPRHRVESHLFGHEKNAFPGADERHPGLLRSARGGTVFLDEVSQLPNTAQSRLVRALERQEILAVGGERPVGAEFRVIAATNRDLGVAVENGAFRNDLYLRLNSFRIDIPPLRKRREDIPALVSYFVKLHSRVQGRNPAQLTNDAMKTFLRYPWPGNVRELSNVIERACILAGGDPIEVAHLPAELLDTQTMATRLKSAVEDFERRHIGWVLRASGGNRERAAQMLEVDPATLYRRIAKYDLRDP